jgi:hypothetical protein
LEKYRGTLDENIRAGGNDDSGEQRSRDAFDTYYSKEKGGRVPPLPRAYRIQGERLGESRLSIIEGHLSTKAVLEKTHEYGATLSEFLTAVLVCSIHEGMNVRDEARPVSITVPVNLRNYFATPSARNFFSVINISHNFSAQGREFKDVLAQVRLSFKAQLTPERIRERLNRLVSLEHAFYIKMAPLAVKILILKTVAWKAEKEDSAAFSNVGKIQMPKELTPYIRSFNVFNSTVRPQICVCSFEDVLSINFSSPLASSNIQRAFFRFLSGLSLDIEIASTQAELQEREITPGGGQDAVLP